MPGKRRQPTQAVNTDNDPLLSYRLEIATFCAAIRTGVPLRCGVNMAFNTTVACLAVNEAIDKKARVDSAHAHVTAP